MTLMSVRSTTSQKGLVAILVEDGGPAVVAVPVNPREGLLLSAGESARTPTWTALVDQVCRTLGGEIDAVELDVDADAALCARVRLSQGGTAHQVPCAPAEALVIAQCLEHPIAASDKLLQLRGLALDAQELSLRFARWREELATMAADEAASST
jgi:hypothetical protein avisC_09011